MRYRWALTVSYCIFVFSTGIHQIFNLHQTEKHPAKVTPFHSFSTLGKFLQKSLNTNVNNVSTLAQRSACSETCTILYLFLRQMFLLRDLLVKHYPVSLLRDGFSPFIQLGASSECVSGSVLSYHKQPTDPCCLFSVPPGVSAWTVWWSEWWNETTTLTSPTSPRGSSPSSSLRSWKSRDTGWTWRRWLPCSSPNTRKSFWWVKRNAIHSSAELYHKYRSLCKTLFTPGSIQLNTFEAFEALLHNTLWHIATGSDKIETHK